MMKRSLLYVGYAMGRFALLGPLIGFLIIAVLASFEGLSLSILFSPFSLLLAYIGGVVPALVAGIVFALFQVFLAGRIAENSMSKKIAGLLGFVSGVIAVMTFFADASSLVMENSSLPSYLLSGSVAGALCGLSCRNATPQPETRA